MKKRTLMSWSTGKDSAWAFHQLTKRDDIELVGLFCTINRKFQRTAMHAVRVELLKLQANRIGLPLDIVEIPWPCSNEEYERIMGAYMETAIAREIQCIAFGDLFLRDIRDYRIEKMNGTGIEPIFPLWHRPTEQLAIEMIEGGIRATITCIDPKQLDPEFAGRSYDPDFLDDLPDNVDPCGENGEFHSFVHDAPMFDRKIDISIAEKVERDGFFFVDLIPVTGI